MQCSRVRIWWCHCRGLGHCCVVQVQSLAQEFPYATGTVKKKKKSKSRQLSLGEKNDPPSFQLQIRGIKPNLSEPRTSIPSHVEKKSSVVLWEMPSPIS